MTIANLKEMMDNGSFHHATYRCIGTLWEGLWIYRRSETGFQGYDVAGSFNKSNPDLELAMNATQGTGVSLGAYGRG